MDRPPPCQLGRPDHDLTAGAKPFCLACGWVVPLPRAERLEGAQRRARIRELIARDGDGCAYCGTDLDDASRTIDEFVPLSAGGQPTLENQVLACGPCNNKKAAAGPVEWEQVRRAMGQRDDAQLAELLRVIPSAVEGWRRGPSRPRPFHQARLAEILGVRST